MALGIVSPEEFIHEIEHHVISHGRGRGRNNVPGPLRELVAGEAIAGASPQELEDLFGVSKSSISAYKNGATSTSTYHNPNPSLQKSNDEVRERIIGPAQEKLIAALNAITEEKLGEAKLKDVAGVARDMSTVVKNMTPDAGIRVDNRTIVFQPRMKEEDDFEVIQVKDE